MPESSTNVEPKVKKDNLKRKSGGSTNEHVKVNVYYSLFTTEKFSHFKTVSRMLLSQTTVKLQIQ